MKFTKRRSLAIVAATVTIAVTGALSGCASTPTDSGATGGGQTIDGVEWPTFTGDAKITVWTWAGPPQTTEVIPAFQKLYPNIEVDVENVGGGSAQYDKLTTVNNAGSGAPDVVMLEYPYIAQFVDSGALADISEYVDPFMSELPAWGASSVTFNDKVYGFPFGGGTEGFTVRPDVFQAAGVAVPTTWDEYAAAAQTIHAADPSKYIGYFPNNDAGYVLALLQQAGVNPFSVDGDGNWTIDLDNQKARDVLTYWGGLIDQGVVPLQAAFTPEWQNAIATGQYASYLAPSWFPSAVLVPYITAGDQTFQVTDLPQWSATGDKVTGNWGGSAYSVTEQSQNKEAASLFAAFMDLGGANDSMAAGSLPVVADATKFPAFEGTPGTQPGFAQNLNKVYQDLQTTVNPDFTFSPWTSAFNDEMTSEIAKAGSGDVEWADVLKNVQSQLVDFAESQGYTVTVGS